MTSQESHLYSGDHGCESGKDRFPILGDMHVRPAYGIEEQCRWDWLVATHHYFGFKGFYGRVVVMSRWPTVPGLPRWVPNGRSKEVYVFDLSGAAPEGLSVEVLEEAVQIPRTEAQPAATLRCLRYFFEEVADFRRARGKQYGLACTLTIAVAARMAGYRGVSDFAKFADLLDDGQREAVGAFWSDGRKRWTVPTESTFRYIFLNLNPDALDEALRNSAHHVGDGRSVAMSRKDIQGSRSRSRTSG